MKTVLVTGAPGWIGSHVTRELVATGHRVLAVARPGEPLDRIADLLARVELIELDLADLRPLEALLRDMRLDIAMHLAWYAAPGRYLNATENLDCLTSSLSLLRLLDQVNCHRTLITGTCFEYDTTLMTPLSEGSPIYPRHLYSACKHALHVAAEQFQQTRGRQLVWPRIFYLYGPWEAEERLMPYVIRKLLNREPCPLTDGKQVRDYLHVEDVARALCAVALSEVTGAVNIASGTPVTVAEVAQTIGRILGAEDWLRLGALPRPSGDPPFVCADTGRLRTEVSWQPCYNLWGGFEQTVAWWRKRLEM